MKLRRFTPLGLLVVVALLVPGGSQSSRARAQGSFSCATVTEIPEAECEALVALHDNTDGANWEQAGGWLATNTPCDW